MSLYRIRGKAERQRGIYYEFDSDDVPLGEGGMGKVYRGRCVDEASGQSRNVAIKFMYSDLPSYAIEKARRESAIRFRHDNLIEMLGFIETEGKTVLGEPEHHYHVVSELLEGVSLDHFFEGKLTDQRGNVVPYAEKLYRAYQQDVNRFAVEIIRNILSGLMTMHDAGYIHRDIDPTNIMITVDGHIKLIDFGIAKKMNSLTAHDKHLTQAGQFVGKPEYAAPELVLGAIDEQNQTTDIYAVGILLFHCIVGHPPFEGDRSEVMQKQIHSPLPLKLIKHKGLREIIAHATEKSRAKRYQSAAEFRVALERLNSAGDDFEWKPLYSKIIGGAVACILACVLTVKIVLVIKEPDPKPKETEKVDEPVVPRNEPVEMNYNTAVALLHDNSPEKALGALQQLSDQGDAQATYLLSRLYYKYKIGDYRPDSIVHFQDLLHLTSNDVKAHQLLEKSVTQGDRDYHSLYELACDYWKADQRVAGLSPAPKERMKSKPYFDAARTLAVRANDKEYVNMIDEKLRDYEKWLVNARKTGRLVK